MATFHSKRIAQVFPEFVTVLNHMEQMDLEIFSQSVDKGLHSVNEDDVVTTLEAADALARIWLSCSAQGERNLCRIG